MSSIFDGCINPPIDPEKLVSEAREMMAAKDAEISELKHRKEMLHLTLTNTAKELRRMAEGCDTLADVFGRGLR